MTTLLVKNADILITMDDALRQYKNGGLFVRDHIIEQVGFTHDLPTVADRVLDAAGMAILPGLVNTHHHFFQSLFRAVPGAQDHGLFDWLTRLFPIFGELTEEAIYISSLTSMAELILSGCTTSSDHHYIYPKTNCLDWQIRAAQEIGLRFHALRGSVSLGQSSGGLTPDYLVEEEEAILQESQRLIETYHNPAPYAMLRIGLAPCTPFTVTKDLMNQSAQLARSYDQVRLHTHVAETLDEVRYCLEKFGQRPMEYMLEVSWVGSDVWWAHSIYLNPDEIKLLAETGTSVAHCPSSNMRLGSGICPVRQMLDAGVTVGIGVDGSASNDTGHLLNEARTAVLLQRVKNGADSMSIEEGLKLVSRNGAAVLGRDDIGSLSVGKAADFIGIDLHTLEMAGGAVHDPLAALLLCRVNKVDLSVIHGKLIVENGQLLSVDIAQLIERHNEIAAEFAIRHPSVRQRLSRIQHT